MDTIKNLSVRDKKISLYLIGLLLIVIAYVLVFSPLMDRYSVLKSNQDELQRQVDQLNEVNRNINSYRSKTGAMKSDIDDFMKDFKSELKEEDDILFAKSLEDKTGVDIFTVNLSQRYYLYTIGVGPSNENIPVEAGEALMPDTLYVTPMSLETEGSYEQFKKYFNEINKESNRKSITSVSLRYDSTTGLLYGDVLMNNYFITDNSKAYVVPEIETISIGLDDIFGTVNKKTGSEE
jgi:Tfp pilus assembly protein PilO